MPGKCVGSLLLPHIVMVGLHMEVIYPSWGCPNHVHPVKCWMLWSVSASLLLFISQRDVAYENRVVHAWCTFGPLSIVLYLSLLSGYKLVHYKTHWRSVLELTVTDSWKPCQPEKLIPFLPWPGFDPSFSGHNDELSSASGQDYASGIGADKYIGGVVTWLIPHIPHY